MRKFTAIGKDPILRKDSGLPEAVATIAIRTEVNSAPRQLLSMTTRPKGGPPDAFFPTGIG
jgi:hypothetical protein